GRWHGKSTVISARRGDRRSAINRELCSEAAVRFKVSGGGWRIDKTAPRHPRPALRGRWPADHDDNRARDLLYVGEGFIFGSDLAGKLIRLPALAYRNRRRGRSIF